MDKTIHPIEHSHGRRCAECDFHAVDGAKILCRLDPPKLFCVPMQTAQGIVPTVMRSLPEMDPDEWCSKFEPIKPTH